jgi:hypothetical protein
MKIRQVVEKLLAAVGQQVYGYQTSISCWEMVQGERPWKEFTISCLLLRLFASFVCDSVLFCSHVICIVFAPIYLHIHPNLLNWYQRIKFLMYSSPNFFSVLSNHFYTLISNILLLLLIPYTCLNKKIKLDKLIFCIISNTCS